MKKRSQVAKRIRTLREEIRKETQVDFAKAIGVSQAIVSSWERGDDTPSPVNYFMLGLRAPGLERDWFWGKAGAYVHAMMGALMDLVKDRIAPPAESEVVRVRCARQTVKGSLHVGRQLVLPIECVPNPGATVAFIIDKSAASASLHAEDVIVVDGSQTNAKDLSPFWDQIVLVDIDGTRDMSINFGPKQSRSSGLLMGLLRYKELRGRHLRGHYPHPSTAPLLWFAILDPYEDFYTEWDQGDAGIYIGHWEMQGRLEEAQAEKEARVKIQLEDACRILGRVIAYFPAERKVAALEVETANGGLEK